MNANPVAPRGNPVRGWWAKTAPIGRSNAAANLVVGAVCLVLAALDLRLGLGTYGRWLLALPFGAVPFVWGLIGWPLGRNLTVARPLRLVGDVLLWAGMALFSVLGLLHDPVEFGPVITLAAFVVVVLIGAIARR